MKHAALIALLATLPGAQLRRDRFDLPTVQRVDRWSMRIDAASVVRHENGMLDVWGVATRVGVFLYDDDDASGQVVREYRPPDEVLDEASLETLRGVPFTIDHPAGDVTSANASDLTNGWVLDVRVDGDLVRTQIRIATDAAKQAIDQGTIELSCGYTARLEELATSKMTPGGERYDAIQRDIRYNHLALVDLARAGHVARLHLDHASRPLRVQRQDQRDRTTPMKIKISYTDAAGKKQVAELPAFALAGLVGESERVDKLDQKRRDAIETGTLSVDTGDGPVELVLPIATIDQVLQMIGAGASAEPDPEHEPDPMAEGEMLEEDDKVPPTGRSFGDKGKIDAAKLEAFIKKTVADAIGEVVPKALSRADAKARERAELERKVGSVLDQGYAFADSDDYAVMADTIGAIDGQRSVQAKLLATKARRGDARSAGRLEAELDHALASRGDEGVEHVSNTMGAVFTMQRDSAERSNDDEISPWEKARADRIAKRSGQKPAEPEKDKTAS